MIKTMSLSRKQKLVRMADDLLEEILIYLEDSNQNGADLVDLLNDVTAMIRKLELI